MCKMHKYMGNHPEKDKRREQVKKRITEEKIREYNDGA